MAPPGGLFVRLNPAETGCFRVRLAHDWRTRVAAGTQFNSSTILRRVMTATLGKAEPSPRTTGRERAALLQHLPKALPNPIA
jgi:hypothetical protein